MSEVRFESRDYSFFCVKHRSHSQLQAVCHDCFDSLKSELEQKDAQIKEMEERWQEALYYLENLVISEEDARCDLLSLQEFKDKKNFDCPHCGQDLRLSPDAKDEIEIAKEKGYLEALRGPEVKALVSVVERSIDFGYLNTSDQLWHDAAAALAAFRAAVGKE